MVCSPGLGRIVVALRKGHFPDLWRIAEESRKGHSPDPGVVASGDPPSRGIAPVQIILTLPLFDLLAFEVADCCFPNSGGLGLGHYNNDILSQLHRD